jgi:histidyl-tRNA synthetase
MQKPTTQLLKGFRDYLPQDALPLQELIRRVEHVFRLYGFAPLMTPVLEYAELLTGKYGPEADKLMYKFVDHGGRAVAMRYDHTVPLARVIASNQNEPMPFKRYTIAPVWRADKPQRGRLREFYQCDVDIVGSDQARADAELLAVAHDLLVALGIANFGIQVSHRGLLEALVRSVGVAKTQVGGVFAAIDKFPKYGEAAFIKDVGGLGLTTEQTQSLVELLGSAGSSSSGGNGGGNKKLFAQLEKKLANDAEGLAALAELTAIFAHAQALGVPETHLNLDLKIVRGLDYYTGMVVETIIADLPLYGSVFGGGRYDALIGQITGKKVPAVGISLGLGRLFDALDELKLLPKVEPAARVLIALFPDSDSAAVEQVARTLRKHEITTEVYLGRPSKIDKQLKYADKRGAAWVVWQGSKEKKKGIYAAKHLATRNQVELTLDQLVEKIQQLA